MPRPPVILIAPDKFRGSMTAAAAARAISRGVLQAIPNARVILRPVADGGEGLIAAVSQLGARVVPITTGGALGGSVRAELAVLNDVVYIESSQFCGLGTAKPTPHSSVTATSAGLGDALRAAALLQPRRIVVGLGGSATTDGAAGALANLGFVFLDRDGARVPLARLASIDRVVPPSIPCLPENVELLAATDVDNILTGPTGAARMYAMQKGADARSVSFLETRMTSWALALERSFGTSVSDMPGAGAAGGMAAGLHAALGARIVSGASLVLDLLDIPNDVDRSDLVITGEGSLDAQSLHGKLPLRIAELARRKSIPVWAITGRAETMTHGFFDRVGQLIDVADENSDPFLDAERLTQKIAHHFATAWALEPFQGWLERDTNSADGS